MTKNEIIIIDIGNRGQKRLYIKDIKSIKTEAKVLGELDHPNIVKYYESMEDSKHLYIITEYLKGETLTNMLTQNISGLNETDVGTIMNQLVSAINYCHANSIVHRDIKPENIIIDNNLHVTLVDFGLSKIYTADQHLKSKAGSPLFMAPEIVEGKYTSKGDIWSLGVLMYVLLSGRLPFSGNSPAEVLQQAVQGDLAFNSDFWKNTSIEAIDLMQQMINLNPESRPTCSKILKHEWFDLIKDETTDDSSDQKEDSILKSLQEFKGNSKLRHSIMILLSKLSKDRDIRVLYQEFRRIDENGDGMISVEDLKNAFDKANIDIADSEIKAIIKKLDLSGNNHINFSEFLVATMNDPISELQLLDIDTAQTHTEEIFRIHEAQNRGSFAFQDFKKAIMNTKDS